MPVVPKRVMRDHTAVISGPEIGTSIYPQYVLWSKQDKARGVSSGVPWAPMAESSPCVAEVRRGWAV